MGRKGCGDGGDRADDTDAEDGVDPRRLHDRRRRHRTPGLQRREPGRKARQLCEQVKDALQGTLAGCADDLVRDLTVISVEPAPNTGRLLVTVAGLCPADAADRDAVADHLSRAAGRLRSSVAAAVNRRHAPELAFRVRE